MILERLRKPTTFQELKDDLERSTTIRVSDEDLEALVKQAVASGLTTSSLCLPVETLMKQAAMRKTGLVRWLLKNYLYIRIPLIRPDAFLEATLGVARLFVSGFALFMYGVLGLTGLGLLIRNWEAYVSTFPYFSMYPGWSGMLQPSWSSRRSTNFRTRTRPRALGCGCRSWGGFHCVVARGFLRRDRRLGSCGTEGLGFGSGRAGITTEFVIAGLALFGWGISRPGVFNSICFVVRPPRFYPPWPSI